MVGAADPERHLGDDHGHRNSGCSSSGSVDIGGDGDADGDRHRPSSARQPHHHQLGHGIVDPIMEDSMSHFSHGSFEGDPTQDGTSNSGEDKDAAFQKGDDLARIESKAILWLRFVALTLLFLTALASSIVVFTVSKNADVTDFETHFETQAQQALESIQTNVATKLGALESLAVGLTSQFGATTTATKKERNATWPFVTIPDFTNRVAPTLALTNALSVGIIPLVTPSLRRQWEQYSVTEGPAWIATDQQAYRDDQQSRHRRRTRNTQSTKKTDESTLRRRIPHQMGTNNNDNHNIQEIQQPQATRTTRHRSLSETPGPFPDFSNGFSSQVYRVQEFPDPTSTDPQIVRQVEPTIYDSNSAPPYYLPLWQNSPVVPGLVNYNVQTSIDNFGPGANACVTSQKAVISMVAMERVGPLGEAIQQVWEPDRLDNKQYGDPWSVLYFPIFDRFEDVTDRDDSGGAKTDSPRTVVGMIQMISYWSTYLDHVTNDDKAKGLVVVLQSVACQKTYTYQMDGSEVTFVGVGDLHDTTYNDLFYEMTDGFEALGKRGGGSGSGSGSLLTPLNLDFCPMSVRVYPSASNRDSYMSSNPRLYTVGVVLAFLFALAIFMCYDRVVERRQKMVLKTAVENRAIVASLFPEAIRDRLFNNNSHESPANKDEQDKRVAATIQSSGLVGGNSRGSGGGGSMFDLNASSMLSLKESASLQLKNYLMGGFGGDYTANGGMNSTIEDSKPIADLFPESTVMFGDIAGFTAWSSQREPIQVFTLLQTLYQAFDKIAKRFRVFKIETIGDCYVAVTGLPEPQPDHAVRMARFARECVYRMQELVKKLEVTLGPDTGDLCLRVGMHSGPVTAGVLRGEKSRFQLFGDTVNTAARMESTGLRNRIQVSVATAELLRKGGREVWLSAREDIILAKGKGEMQTFWVATRTSAQVGNLDSSLHHNVSTHGSMVGMMTKVASTASLNNSAVKNNAEIDHHDDKYNSNIPMHIGVKTTNKDRRSNHSQSKSSQDSDASLLSGGSFGAEDDDEEEEEEANAAPVIPAWTTRMVEASQRASSNEKEERLIDWHVDLLSRLLKRIIARRNIASSRETRAEVPAWRGSGKLVVEEVVDFISFAKVDDRIASIPLDPDSVDLGEDAQRQLKEFMQRIAKMYQSNPFHNFAHASQVAMSTHKLFNRIVTPTKKTEGEPTIAADIYDYTARIKYDPLVHFAVVLSAVFHDADHEGLGNMDLIREKSDFAECYGNRTVAEQHSVEVAWELLMDPAYKDLQHCIYKDQEEFRRFRQIIVQMVIATDIFDKDLKAFRERRWKQAFEGIDTPKSEDELQNLRATVMLEHTIQASDVGHAMQHWQIFKKWNERLFEEMVFAYERGYSIKDPTGGWYEGEIMFFDFYIIPLANKLLESKAFGVAGDEYLNYAVDNRAEWAAKGMTIVREMASKYHRDKILGDLLQKASSVARMDLNRSMGRAA